MNKITLLNAYLFAPKFIKSFHDLMELKDVKAEYKLGLIKLYSQFDAQTKALSTVREEADKDDFRDVLQKTAEYEFDCIPMAEVIDKLSADDLVTLKLLLKEGKNDGSTSESQQGNERA